MKISDYIAQNGVDSVAAFLKSSPDYAVFNLTWSSPEEILPACNRMGLITIDDVIAFVQRVNAAVGNTLAFANNVNPDLRLDLQAMKRISWPEIHAAIAAQVKLEPTLMLDHQDAKYFAPTKAQWEMIAKTCPSIRRRHSNSEVHDCDDFVRHFLGWLASKGYGNLAMGYCCTVHYFNGQAIGAHATVLVLDSDGKVWQIEPQSGALYAPLNPKLGGFFIADEAKAARLFF